MKQTVLAVLTVVCLGTVRSSAAPELRATGAPRFGEKVDDKHPGLLINEIGVGETHVISNGYVFIDHRYIIPPYKVQRIGMAITINQIVINNPLQHVPTSNEMARAKTDWRSAWYAWTPETAKKTADRSLYYLVPALQQNGVLTVSAETYQKRHGGLSQVRLPRVLFLDEQDVIRIVSAALSDDGLDKKLDAAKKGGAGALDDDDWRTFLKNCAESAGLRERLKDKLPKE